MFTTTDDPGILITRVRGYNTVALFSGGQRGAVNRRLADVCDVRPASGSWTSGVARGSSPASWPPGPDRAGG